MTGGDFFLFNRILNDFDRAYSAEFGLLEAPNGAHTVRDSANYALALLMAGGRDDRAARVIRSVLGTQYRGGDPCFAGTFKRCAEEPDPPPAPVVWDDYDPNWREFVSTVIAVILAEYSDRLPAGLAAEMESSARFAVEGSIARYIADDTPLNTNIELMHVFITDFFGRRFGDSRFLERSRIAAERLYGLFSPHRTVSEFNSTTYYGVDFIALACILKYCRTPEIRRIAAEVQSGLWQSLADFYNPSLANPAAPYSRCYEMDMAEHSSLGAILYRSLGEEYRPLAKFNCESFTDPLIVAAGAAVPPELASSFTSDREGRLVSSRFVELCERHPKGGRHFLCAATAWIEPGLMYGGLSGSRNTSGQLHPAAAMWRSGGDLHWIRLSRRRPGDHWSRHFTGVYFDCSAERGRLRCSIDLPENEPIEVFLEFGGPRASESLFRGDSWVLPGLELTCRFGAEDVKVRNAGDRLEMYALHAGERNRTMLIELENFRRTTDSTNS